MRSFMCVGAAAVALGAVTLAPGGWRRIPASPIVPDFGRRTSVWTGRELIAFGRVHVSPGTLLRSVNVAAAFDPSTGRWRKLAPPPGRPGSFGPDTAVWTGREMLVLGSGGDLAFEPRSDRWRPLPDAPGPHALNAWTGRLLIGWGGGCCGDAQNDGDAYDLATNAWRRLPASPLAGSQQPIGAWTGRELIVLVGDLDPNGRPWPARLARAAAYDPVTRRWHRIAPLPDTRNGASAAWDGRELLVVGGAANPAGGRPGALARTGFAYDPRTNHWRPLAPMPSGRAEATAIWTGSQLVLWGGASGGEALAPLTYDPRSDRWSRAPRAPLPARAESSAVWTGRALVVWGGVSATRDGWGAYRSVAAELRLAGASRR